MHQFLPVTTHTTTVLPHGSHPNGGACKAAPIGPFSGVIGTRPAIRDAVMRQRLAIEPSPVTAYIQALTASHTRDSASVLLPSTRGLGRTTPALHSLAQKTHRYDVGALGELVSGIGTVYDPSYAARSTNPCTGRKAINVARATRVHEVSDIMTLHQASQRMHDLARAHRGVQASHY